MRYIVLLSLLSLLFFTPEQVASTLSTTDDADQTQAAPPPPEPTGPISDEIGGPPATTQPSAPESTETDGSAIDETGTELTVAAGFESETGSLPDTGGPDTTYTRITCGEVRDINREYYVLSLGRRFGKRNYVITPATYFSPSGYSFEMIGPGDRVMISYVTVHGIRIAVHITIHE